MKQRSLFRPVLIICLAVSVLVPVVNIYVIYPQFRSYVYDVARDNSIRLAGHLKGNVVDENGDLEAPAAFQKDVDQLRRDIGIQVIRVYDNRGVVIYSTDAKDIGTKSSSSEFFNSVVRGKDLSTLDTSSSLNVGGETVSRNVVKTYVPIMKRTRFLGAFEIHNDVTGQLYSLERLLYKLTFIPILGMSLFCAVIWHLIRRLRNDVGQIERLSMTDGLTGLLNRGTLMEKLHFETGRARRYQHPIALMVCDVDNFKQINDTFGHQVGDEALKSVSGALRSLARTTDIIGRYGGDEFIVVLPESGGEGASQFASRLMASLREEQNRSVHVSISIGHTLSIGIAVMVPGAPVSAEELLRLADKALYEAKKSGKNRMKLVTSVYVDEPEGSLLQGECITPNGRRRVLSLPPAGAAPFDPLKRW